MVQPLTCVDPDASVPPIDLEIEPATPSPATDCENSNTALDTEQKETAGDLPLRRPSWLSLVRKLLHLQNTDVEEPPKST